MDLWHGRTGQLSKPEIEFGHSQQNPRGIVRLSRWPDTSHHSVRSISYSAGDEGQPANTENIGAVIVGRYWNLRDFEEVERFPLRIVLVSRP